MFVVHKTGMSLYGEDVACATAQLVMEWESGCVQEREAERGQAGAGGSRCSP